MTVALVAAGALNTGKTCQHLWPIASLLVLTAAWVKLAQAWGNFQAGWTEDEEVLCWWLPRCPSLSCNCTEGTELQSEEKKALDEGFVYLLPGILCKQDGYRPFSEACVES